MEKWLSFESGEQHFASGFSVFLLSFSSCGTHLLDLSHGFQTYGDGFSSHIQLIRELLLSLSVILISNNACNSLSSNFFGGFPCSSFLTSKSPLLNFLNHSKHCDLPSMLTVSFDKHSMRFCSSFLQMITENQYCPQIVVSRHKIRHVQRYYKLYCCMKLVLLWIENLCQMSEQGNDVNGAVWRQLRWQLWPSIGKFRFHIYVPDT